MEIVVIAVKHASEIRFFNQDIQRTECSIQRPFDSTRLDVKLLIAAIASNDLRAKESRVHK